MIWIIKTLWNLGQDILLSRFSRIFDADSINFLLDIAKLDIKLSENSSKLSEAKLASKEDRIRMQ